jgi:hypothetical protein
MPPAAIIIDTGAVDPDTAARKIAGLLGAS